MSAQQYQSSYPTHIKHCFKSKFNGRIMYLVQNDYYDKMNLLIILKYTPGDPACHVLQGERNRC